MGNKAQHWVKPTLDKDLDKITHVEEATYHVARRLAAPGAGLIFLVLAAMFAAVYVTGQPGATVIVSAAAIAAYMAMNIGANDVTNNIGAAVGARAITLAAGLCIAAVFEIAGALIAGGNVANTIANEIVRASVIGDPEIFVWVMISALVSAALWINLATWLNAPISTTHAIVGGVMGAGVAAAGVGAVNWISMGGITLSWIVSPLLGGIIAAAMLAFIKEFIVYRTDKIAAARIWVPVLNAVMAGTFVAYLAFIALQAVIQISLARATGIGFATGIAVWLISRPLIRRQSIGLENRNQSLRTLFQIPLIFSAALLSFAHGANDVSNAIGPLSAILHAVMREEIAHPAEIPLWAMTIGAFGISCGLLLFGPKLIQLVGSQITKLNPMRAFCVALSAAMTVIVASWLGLPVSSTHIAIGAVFGVGFFREWYTRHSRRRFRYVRARAAGLDIDEPREHNIEEARGRYLVRRSHFMTIIAAWVITVPASASLAAVLYWIMYLLSV